MKNADLHAHTRYSSDGELTPRELVKKAKKAKLKYIAITDHDSIKGVAEALKAGKEFGVEVIPGVELHSKFGEVLGFFINYKNKDLIAICNKNKKIINERAHRTIKLLKKDGYKISATEIKKRYKTDVVERAFIAYELIRKKYAKSFRDVFDRFLVKGQKYYVEANSLPTLEIIKIIKRAGGVAAFAHPYYENYEQEFKHIKEFIKAGLVGIELKTGGNMPDNYQKVAKLIKNILKKYKLILVSGSDFHGKAHPAIKLGKSNCDEKVVIKLKRLLK